MSEVQTEQPAEMPELASQPGAVRRFLGRIGLHRFAERGESTTNPFEHQNFAEVAPTLADVASTGVNRESTMYYLPEDAHKTADFIQDLGKHPDATQVTEGEALKGFMGFLSDLDHLADQVVLSPSDVHAILEAEDEEKIVLGARGIDMPRADEDIPTWIHRKVDALRHTSFLGSTEFDKATAGIAEYWKAFLQEDTNSQICVVTGDSHKSDAFVLEEVLSHFSDEEIEKYRKQFVRNMYDMTADPQHAKIVMLDDWMMSGDQMHIRGNTPGLNYSFAKGGDPPVAQTLEINLLIADERRLVSGSTYNHLNVPIPVKAYYKAPDAKDADDENPNFRYFSRISGTHSTADIAFAITVNNILAIMKASVVEGVPNMPPLTNIVRQYRDAEHPRTALLFRKTE